MGDNDSTIQFLVQSEPLLIMKCIAVSLLLIIPGRLSPGGQLSLITPSSSLNIQIFGLNIHFILNLDLIFESVEVHDEVLGGGVPVPDLALVAIGVPLHLTPLSLLLIALLRSLLHEVLLHLPLCGQGHEVLVQPGHLRRRGLRVVSDPVVRVVDLDEGGHELGLCLADVAAPSLLWAKHRVVVQRIIDHRMSC